MKELQNRTLFYGDNLEILREKFPGDDGYFDLIYLDPPFNSNRSYNVIFKEGFVDSSAQSHAFEDSWHWSNDAEHIFNELIGVKPSQTKINQSISDLMQAFEKMVGKNDMLAYLTMMTIRLIELKRVLKPTGSIYLHCDPTASHYLKIMMDVNEFFAYAMGNFMMVKQLENYENKKKEHLAVILVLMKTVGAIENAERQVKGIVIIWMNQEILKMFGK